MKMRKLAVFAALLIILGQLVPHAAATPSIDDLHTEATDEVEIAGVDDTNTAEILAQEGVYLSQAVPSQYTIKNALGEIVETELSQMVRASESVICETGVNGQGIQEEIPSVSQLLHVLRGEEPEDGNVLDIDPNRLDQLTYMMDLKYITTGYRVATGVQTSVSGQAVYLEDGRIRVTLRGGEVIRGGSMDDYVILLVNPHTNQPVFLRMQEYNEKTGDYTVEFPFIGPFMVTQIMR